MAYSTIDKSSLFQNTLLYTGNGSSNALTGVGFSPNLVWLKSRSTGYNNYTFDTVRGVKKWMSPSQTTAETSQDPSLNTFDADGFTLGAWDNINENSATHVGWNWKAGTTSGISGGTITPSAYSFNTTSGCSILKWTGTGSNATIPHGLGAAPGIILCKSTTSTDNWAVYHKSRGASKYLTLDTNEAELSNTNAFQGVEPTSSVFSVGTSGRTNGSGSVYIAYAFSPVKGYSKFSTYKGNGNANGPIIYTGFKPTFLLIKKATGSTANWYLFDNKRGGYNVANYWLYANTNNSENATGGNINLLSNGFKVINSEGDINNDNSTYVYMAFGQPIVGSNGVTATAR